MDADTILQELPSQANVEPFQRSSRPLTLHTTDSCTTAAQNVHFVMRQLEQILAPHKTCISSLQDVVLLSLDLEYDSQRIHQIGLSSLHVGQIKNLPQSIQTTISNDLYLLQRNTIRADKCQYRYGEAKIAKHLTIQEILSPFLAPPHKVVLIGQAVHNDVLILQRSGFDITKTPNIISFIDLAPTASYLLNDTTRQLSLKHVCRRLGIRTCGFHNAGHDALYTLQALLLLFCQYKSQKEEATDVWARILPLPEEAVPERGKEETMLWQCQIDAIRYVANQASAALWTGSPKQRKRKAQKLQAESG